MARWQLTVKGGAPYQNGPCKGGAVSEPYHYHFCWALRRCRL